MCEVHILSVGEKNKDAEKPILVPYISLLSQVSDQIKHLSSNIE